VFAQVAEDAGAGGAVIVNIDSDNATIFIQTPDGVTRVIEPFQSVVGRLCLTRTKPFPKIKHVFISSPEQQKAFEVIRTKWMNGGVSCD